MADTPAGAARIRCRVVTPEGMVLDRSADAVVVTAIDGEMGILQNHAPMLAVLGMGPMRVRSGEETQALAVDGGFLQVRRNDVTVLATRAVAAAAIDRAAVDAEERDLGDPPKSGSAREAWGRARAWIRLRRRIAPPPPSAF